MQWILSKLETHHETGIDEENFTQNYWIVITIGLQN